METKHIEAPWRVAAFGDASYRVESHTHTEVFGEDATGQKCVWSEHTMATANLIAAAPDLLEALQFLMVASGEQLTTAFEQAQDAIAKATASNASFSGGPSGPSAASDSCTSKG